MEVKCTTRDKEKEKKTKDERKLQLEKLKEKIQKIQDSLTTGNSEFKEMIRFQMMNCR